MEMKISLHQTISDFFARSDETKADFDKFAPLLEKILENEISNIKSSDTYNLMLHYIDIKEEVCHISNKTSDIYNALVIFLGEDTFQEILNERIAVAKFFSRRIVGESLSCAKVICEIAAFFYSYNKIQDSLKISEKALKITKQLLEEPRCEDKESIEIYQKRISTAHQYYESALLINRLSRGEKTQEIVGYYEHLADLCYDINDCDKELFFLKKALETSLFVNGKINYVTFRICKHLGLCYYNCSYKYFNWALGSNFNNIKSTDALAYRSRAEDYIAKYFEYYDKALEMTEDYSEKAHIYCDIGEVWLENWDLNHRDYSKALEFFNKSLENNLLSVKSLTLKPCNTNPL